MLIPHEDKVDVITPFNIGHRGWRILIPHEDKVDDITPVNIGHRGWQILIPHEDKVDAIIPINVWFCYVTITSLGERSGCGQHVLYMYIFI